MDNFQFVAGVTSITMGISIEAAGDNCAFINCFAPKPTTTSWEFLDMIDVADGANDILVYGFEYYNDEAGAAAAHFIDAGNGSAGPERLQVVRCTIKGDFSVAAIWSDEPCDEAFISNNTINNHTTGQHCIEFTDNGTTGFIEYNNLAGDEYGSILDPGAMQLFGNMQSVGADASAEEIPLIPGKTYSRKMLLGDTNASQDICSVTGSQIIVKSFVGKATIAVGGATVMKINCDADDTFDYDISTSVDIDTVDAGGLLTFTAAAGESVLAVQTVGSSGSMGVDIQWFVEEGMLESTLDSGGSTGNIEWYMIFTPVGSGCEVIPQPGT